MNVSYLFIGIFITILGGAMIIADILPSAESDESQVTGISDDVAEALPYANCLRNAMYNQTVNDILLRDETIIFNSAQRRIDYCENNRIQVERGDYTPMGLNVTRDRTCLLQTSTNPNSITASSSSISTQTYQDEVERCKRIFRPAVDIGGVGLG